MECKRNRLLCEASACTLLSGQVARWSKGLDNSFANYPGLLTAHVFPNQGRHGTDQARASVTTFSHYLSICKMSSPPKSILPFTLAGEGRKEKNALKQNNNIIAMFQAETKSKNRPMLSSALVWLMNLFTLLYTEFISWEWTEYWLLCHGLPMPSSPIPLGTTSFRGTKPRQKRKVTCSKLKS